MRKLAIVFSMLAASPALATTPDELGDQAERCWNIPAGLTELPDITFDVLFDGSGGVKDISVVNFKPEGEAGRAVVIGASKAIQLCAPYTGTSEGVARVRMHWEPEGETIDPFKPIKK